ncbi:hypothetical protein BKA70DRAFT_1424408 [Coprinopsis sp. MPI-PUGE-AT-0042]|nr:hypothetical protein BKA70DRAFT_1424408 [Coprinopsis sp. MPI-PUGE-AT-0042]
MNGPQLTTTATSSPARAAAAGPSRSKTSTGVIRLSFEFPRHLMRTQSDSRILKPMIRQVEQGPRGARPPLKTAGSEPVVPVKRKKSRPTPLALPDENSPPSSSPSSSKPLATGAGAAPLSTRRPLPPPSAPGHTPTPSFGSGRSVRPLPSVPPSSAVSASGPDIPVVSPQSDEKPYRPLPQPPSETPPLPSADEQPPLDLATILTTLLTSASQQRPTETVTSPVLPEIPPLTPIFQTSFSSAGDDNDSTPKAKPPYNPSANNDNKENNNKDNNDLLKPSSIRPSLHIDVSPRTARRMKGAAMNPTDKDCTILADMFRQFKEQQQQQSSTTGIMAPPPTSFFCEEMLSKTNAVIMDDGESSLYDSPASLRSRNSRRHTVLSVVSSEGGYELQFRVGGDSSDEDDYYDDEDDDGLSYVEESSGGEPIKEASGEVVTWEWIVKDGVAALNPAKAPSTTSSGVQVRQYPERLSRRWWREKNGVVVEEDYHNVVNILRSLR